jgi:hypothetical protein
MTEGISPSPWAALRGGAEQVLLIQQAAAYADPGGELVGAAGSAWAVCWLRRDSGLLLCVDAATRPGAG